MLAKIIRLALAVTTAFFIFGIVFLFFFVPRERLLLQVLQTQLDLRLFGMIFCLVMTINNLVLLTLQRIDFLGRYALKLSVNSPAKFHMEQEIPVSLHLQKEVEVQLDEVFELSIPIDQDADVMVRDKVMVPVDVTVHTPVDEEVEVEAVVPIKTVIHLDTWIETQVLGKAVKIPINVKVPIDTQVPVTCKARVRKKDFSLRIKDTIPLGVEDVVHVHMKTEFKTKVPLRKVLKLPLDIKMQTRVQLDPTVPLQIKGDFILSKDSLKMKVIPDKNKT